MKMDCLTFRRQLLEDPSRKERALLAHEAGCSACAGFAAKVRADEAKLAEALNIEPPAELVERIQLAVSFGEAPERKPTRPWLAIAASAVLAVTAATLGWVQYQHRYEDLSLERSVLHHVADEISHLYEPGPAEPDQLRRVFARFGARVSEDAMGQVSFAGICMMRRNNGVHLVMRGQQGPVTVFFMPGEHTTDMLKLDTERFAGMIEPTTWGSIAVVGEQGEELAPVLARVRQAVAWPAARIGLLADAPRVAQR